MRGAAHPLHASRPVPTAGDEDALEAFAAAALDLVRSESIERALGSLVAAVGRAAAARLVIARLVDTDGEALVARAVHAESSALAAELEGTLLPVSEVDWAEAAFAAAPEDPSAPSVLRRAAAKAGASTALLVPVEVGGEIVASLELLRPAPPFSLRERALARVAAAQLATAVHAERAARAGADGKVDLTQASLGLLGEALAAGADEAEAAEQVARLAAGSVGAAGAAVWRIEPDAPPTLLASDGLAGGPPDPSTEAEQVRRALDGQHGDEAAGRPVVTLPLGDPPVAALRLFFADEVPGEEELGRLAPFAGRAALALRRARRISLLSLALERSQTLVAVVSQAISQLSLAHTLETAVDRVAELTSSKHVAVYLREGGHLSAAASRGLAGSHTELAERLLELALGPFRSRGYLFIEDLRLDPRLSGLESVPDESGVRRALFIPLVVHEDVIGALAVFRRRPRPYREGEEALLIALSSQLAIAVQNARLHEETKKLGAELRRRLDTQRRIARELQGYSAIFQSFAESLSLEATLDAVARTVVELFDLDGAAIRLRDQRGETLELRSLHVADPKLRGPVEALLGRPQPLTDPLVQRVMRTRRPILLAPGAAGDGGAAETLGPFLHQGSTAAVLPLVTPAEALGNLTLLSLDPTRPLAQEGVEAAMAVTAQAALAIDNARLYQQQKDFAETMQRSLLPRALPDVRGLEVGHVYESAARVDVGGDVYDFLTLEDGRLAVVVGDVLGKGISAAADMAMARFSFRALARSHPEPSEFLAEVNEVVVEEIEPAKFITLLYVLVDPVAGEVACASAGHPPLRLVSAAGEVSPIAAGGLALGIEPEQQYPAERLQLEQGSAVVLYTDGVVEARRNGELYGEERLDRLLADRRGQGAQELADAVLADCQAFAGGELDDDCAVVVIKLAP